MDPNLEQGKHKKGDNGPQTGSGEQVKQIHKQATVFISSLMDSISKGRVAVHVLAYAKLVDIFIPRNTSWKI